MNRLLLFLAMFIPSTMALSQLLHTNVSNNISDQTESSIAVSPVNGNNLLSVWIDTRDGFPKVLPGLGYSTDGGGTWQTYELHPSIVIGFNDTVNFTYCANHTAAFDRNGNVYCAFLAKDHYPDVPIRYNDYGAIVVARASWPPTSANSWTFAYVDSASQNDKPYITVDNTGGTGHDGNIYVVWTRFDSTRTQILYSSSTDHGSTFYAADTLATSSGISAGTSASELYLHSVTPLPKPTVTFVQGAIPAVGSNGTVYVAWEEPHPEAIPQLNASHIRMKMLPYGDHWSSEIELHPIC